MFELTWGIIYIAISIIGSLLFLFVLDSVSFVHYLFLVPFFIFGVKFLLLGFKKIKIDSTTKRKGYETYGLVIAFAETDMLVNENPILKARVVVDTKEYGALILSERVGTDPQFNVGDYVSIRFFNDDMNIIERISEYSVPDDVKTKLLSKATPDIKRQKNMGTKREYKDFIVQGDYIIVDGVKYKRPT